MHWRGQMVKTGGDNCYFDMKTETQNFKEHEESRKHDTIKGAQ